MRVFKIGVSTKAEFNKSNLMETIFVLGPGSRKARLNSNMEVEAIEGTRSELNVRRDDLGTISNLDGESLGFCTADFLSHQPHQIGQIVHQ